MINGPSRAKFYFALILGQPWYMIFLIMGGSFIAFNLVFGTIFYLTEGFSFDKRETDVNGLTFWTAFFFALQTMDTIGYGLLSPTEFRCDVMVAICSVFANFYWIWFGGLVLAKMVLPKKLRHQIQFSTVGVMNRQESVFSETKNDYVFSHDTCLIFRVMDAYVRNGICDSDFHLMYFRTATRLDGYEEYVFDEMDYEINRQVGRTREMALSTPLLGLPWTVVHPVNDNSPLLGKTLQEMERENGEIIAVVDGIDEMLSCNYQARWSWKSKEIRVHHRFVPCVRLSEDGLGMSVDFSRLSLTEPITDEREMSFFSFSGVTSPKQKRLSPLRNEIIPERAELVTPEQLASPPMAPFETTAESASKKAKVEARKPARNATEAPTRES